MYPLAVALHFLPPQAQETAIFFFYRFAYSGPFIVESYNIQSFMTGCLHLAQCFQVHPCCNINQCFIPFHDQIIFTVCMYYMLFIHLSVNGHLGCIHFWTVTSNAAVNICILDFVFTLLGNGLHFFQVHTHTHTPTHPPQE